MNIEWLEVPASRTTYIYKEAILSDNPFYYEYIDLSSYRQVLICGDIHGCFSRLEKELDNIGFDKDQDFLVSVGDLVDRGPESEQSIYWMDEPWFKNVLGNHEVMPLEDPGLHCLNGGGWMWHKMDHDNATYYAKELMKAPTVLEFKAPNGKNYGVVHAEWPMDTEWNRENIDYLLNNYYSRQELIWGRHIIYGAKDGHEIPSIEGITKVFHGHTPLKEAIVSGNRHWIDTGAVFGGPFTIVKVE